MLYLLTQQVDNGTIRLILRYRRIKQTKDSERFGCSIEGHCVYGYPASLPVSFMGMESTAVPDGDHRGTGGTGLFRGVR